MKIMVTGGAGYIGSHVAHTLVETGHEVVVLDDLSTGARRLVPPAARFVHGSVANMELVVETLEREGVDAVAHFAGSIVVPESVARPLDYYANNTGATRSLLRSCRLAKVDKFLFSSTAAVYGEPAQVPVAETADTRPINPYGRSKLMSEWMLEDLARASSLRYVALRYFNVAGADLDGRTGQCTPNATHLIKVATQTALGRREAMAIFGADYGTPDGTCVRDYIHVNDLADAHVLALDHLAAGGETGVFNCGYGHGYSVREVIDAVREVSGVAFEVREVGRRAGDPPELVADSSKLRRELGWEPRRDDLALIVRTALDWERTLEGLT